MIKDQKIESDEKIEQDNLATFGVKDPSTIVTETPNANVVKGEDYPPLGVPIFYSVWE